MVVPGAHKIQVMRSCNDFIAAFMQHGADGTESLTQTAHPGSTAVTPSGPYLRPADASLSMGKAEAFSLPAKAFLPAASSVPAIARRS